MIKRVYISKQDSKMTDLKSEVNNARFHEEKQYGLHRALSSP